MTSIFEQILKLALFSDDVMNCATNLNRKNGMIGVTSPKSHPMNYRLIKADPQMEKYDLVQQLVA